MTGPELRIGDAERDAAVTALGEHYVAGRLTKEEYDDRSAVVWRARTGSDLAPLFADLPPLHDSRRRGAGVPRDWGRASPERAGRHGGRRFPLFPLMLVLVALVMLTESLPFVLLLVGLLWWTGALRWLRHGAARSAPARTGPAGHWPRG